ncbi:hypothetical protein DSO57_1036902 [Entomophthora muscae]|uniref:Uncharacterized protein n=1 Tax=Entomophthora muscae TaxID=34485 RepID=A0ACC2RQ64_9FUNG|nr:hypothetical protein DSO57_1036902 [Entomophthora muscae]
MHGTEITSTPRFAIEGRGFKQENMDHVPDQNPYITIKVPRYHRMHHHLSGSLLRPLSSTHDKLKQHSAMQNSYMKKDIRSTPYPGKIRAINEPYRSLSQRWHVQLHPF